MGFVKLARHSTNVKGAVGVSVALSMILQFLIKVKKGFRIFCSKGSGIKKCANLASRV